MREFEALRGADAAEDAADTALFDARMAELEAGSKAGTPETLRKISEGYILHLGGDLSPRKRASCHLDMQPFHHPAVQRQDP
jgi:hypothetical protein